MYVHIKLLLFGHFGYNSLGLCKELEVFFTWLGACWVSLTAEWIDHHLVGFGVGDEGDVPNGRIAAHLEHLLQASVLLHLRLRELFGAREIELEEDNVFGSPLDE